TRASRGAVAHGGAVYKACQGLRDKLLARAAEILEAHPNDLVFNDGFVKVKGTNLNLSLKELGKFVYSLYGGSPSVTISPDMSFKHSFVYDPSPAVANAIHMAEIEVDIQTWKINIINYWVVEDCGRIINPLIVDGQVIGAVAQGIGETLLEQI